MKRSLTYNYGTMVLIIAVLIAAVGDVFSQTFSCNRDIYIAQYNDVQKRSDILILDLEDNFSYRILELKEARHITALGYSVADEYLYALDFETKELLKIDASGHITSLGVPTDLDLSLSYYSGTVNALGTGLRVIGRDAEDNANKYFSINLFTDDHYAGYSSVITDQDISATDIAIDPYRGIMYGYDNQRYEMFVISAGAAVTSNNFTPGSLSMSALFFDKSGHLYGYRSNGDLYSIKKTNGELQKIAKLPPSSFADAASCSASYLFTKELQSDIILPCDTFSLVYTFTNRIGIGQAGMYLNDTLPPDYEIVDIDLRYYYGSSLEMLTPNILSLSNFDFVLDENQITVKVVSPSVNATNHTWATSGYLSALPKALGAVAKTDDPLTMEADDATAVHVYDVDILQLEDYIQKGCAQLPFTINSPLPNADNLWHDGSTNASYTVLDTGWVSLLAIDNCNVYSDSIYIDKLGKAKYARIIDRQTKYHVGDEVNLSFETNLSSPYLIEWKIDGQQVSDMPEYSFITDANHLIVLNVISEDCQLSDVLTIGMETGTNTYIPNAFSPNGDGINENFAISTTANGNYDLTIYDRWGNILYEGVGLELNSNTPTWDGTFKGQNVSDNIFIWKVEIYYADGMEEVRTGEVIVYD